MKIEFDEKCPSCKGTGLYVGMGERDGYAVVCHTCNGTGKHHFVHEYDEFEGRVPRKGVHTVVEVNPGICLGGEKGELDFGGMPFEDWDQGKPFPPGSEMREYTCPVWWYQSADYSKKPKWDWCNFGRFSACNHFPHKYECWERWDREFGGETATKNGGAPHA